MHTAIIQKMIHFYEGSIHDIEHFLKVHSYAMLIGQLEQLDQTLLSTLEIAAIVHDISCPLCRRKYGNAGGAYQEAESEALLRPFLAEFNLPSETLERVIWLVCHHHTYAAIDGPDAQILIEADFLVNAAESHLSRDSIQNFREKTAKTAACRQLLDSLYLRSKEKAVVCS